jgi:hypothetical protein
MLKTQNGTQAVETTDMIARHLIEARLEHLRGEQAALIEQANRQLAAIQGAIAALESLLAQPAPDEAEGN